MLERVDVARGLPAAPAAAPAARPPEHRARAPQARLRSYGRRLRRCCCRCPSSVASSSAAAAAILPSASQSGQTQTPPPPSSRSPRRRGARRETKSYPAAPAPTADAGQTGRKLSFPAAPARGHPGRRASGRAFVTQEGRGAHANEASASRLTPSPPPLRRASGCGRALRALRVRRPSRAPPAARRVARKQPCGLRGGRRKEGRTGREEPRGGSPPPARRARGSEAGRGALRQGGPCAAGLRCSPPASSWSTC